jgi:formylmethanofuran dehydrogenase subunit C
MALVLTLRSGIDLPIDLSSIQPGNLVTQSHLEVAERRVRIGNAEVAVGEIFSLSGTLEDATIIFEGDLRAAEGIGRELAEGNIVVRGSVGSHTGWRMKGGTISIDGNAGHSLGAAMAGGTIRVRGDAGDDVGFDAGRMVGMIGGTITIDGSAGRYVGRKIRRGTIAVRGSIALGAMTDAIAGTVLVLGSCDRLAGAGMRRGSLILLGDEPTEMLPTFRRGRHARPLMLSLLIPHLASLGFGVDHHFVRTDLRQYHGDQSSLGLGEIFTRHQGG